jgi:hypothetical protein
VQVEDSLLQRVVRSFLQKLQFVLQRGQFLDPKPLNPPWMIRSLPDETGTAFFITSEPAMAQPPPHSLNEPRRPIVMGGADRFRT